MMARFLVLVIPIPRGDGAGTVLAAGAIRIASRRREPIVEAIARQTTGDYTGTGVSMPAQRFIVFSSSRPQALR